MESVPRTIRDLENEEYNDGDSKFQYFGCFKCKCDSVCTCNCYAINCGMKGKENLSKNETEEIERKEYIYKKWSINGCQLYYGLSFQQLLIKHLGINLASYFMVFQIIFIWVTAMFILGVLVTAASFYTMHDNINPATPICKGNFTDHYMCPLCDNHCSFWYLKQAISSDLCTRHFRLIFDNPIIWAYTFIVIVSALSIYFVMIFCLVKCRDYNSTSESENATCSYASYCKTPDEYENDSASLIPGESNKEKKTDIRPGKIELNIYKRHNRQGNGQTKKQEEGQEQSRNANLEESQEKEGEKSQEDGRKHGQENRPNIQKVGQEGQEQQKKQKDEKHQEQNKTDCSICCPIITAQCFWVILAISFIGGSFYLMLVLSLIVEKEVRKYLIRNYSASTFGILILATVPNALLQVLVNAIVKRVCKLIYNSCYCINKKEKIPSRCNLTASHFVLTLIPVMVISYLPIIYRIVFYGKFVGDPTEGYNHPFGEIRYQHCPSYGCMDVGVYVFIGICSQAIMPTLCLLFHTFHFKCFNKSFSDCYSAVTNCCKTCECCSSDKNSCRNRRSSDGNCCSSNENCSLSLQCFKLAATNSDHLVDNYSELLIIYGYVILFISATGFTPFLAALITLALIARYKANYYVNWKYAEVEEERQYKPTLHYPLIVLLIITLLSVFTNLTIVIFSSRFIQHLSYSLNKDTPNQAFLNFDGYLDQVFPKHNLTTLVETNIFPDYEADNLPMLYPNGKEVRNSNGEVILYLPYIDFKCLHEYFPDVGENFTRTQYQLFISKHLSNNTILKYSSKGTVEVQRCFNTSVTCQSRGYLSGSSHSKNYHEALKMAAYIGFPVLFVISLIILIIGLIFWCFCFCKR